MSENNFKTEWDLSDYYKGFDDTKIDSDMENVKDLIEKFISKYKGNIGKLDPKGLIEFMDDENEFGKIITKIQIYFLYASSLDTQNQEIIKKQDELSHTLTELGNKLLFVSQEFKDRGYDDLIALSNNPELEPWKNHFFQKAESIKYLLDEKTEFALNLKSNCGGSAFSNLYEELTNSFMFKVTIDGEEKMMTDSEVRSLRSSPKEEVRKESFRALREVYGDKKVQISLGNSYSNILKDWTSELKLRGFNTVMEQRNKREELDNEVVDTLLDEVSKSYPMYQRYLSIKSKLLGREDGKLNVWDVMAPVGSDSEKEYSFDEGLNMFLDTIKEFDSEFFEFSKDMFEKARVDVFPKEGKRGGAFACYDKGFDSYVMLNWTSKLRDVATLAHELGHAMHGNLAQIQKEEVYSSSLSLAETASIFNEMVLYEKLLNEMSDSEKIKFLDERLGDVFATIHRQIQYVLFERKCHETIHSGKGLTYSDFNSMWREEQVKMSGDVIDYHLDTDKETGWSMIPHIFRSPFYCYSYSFGNILTFALYEQYREEGESFIPKYKDLLACGGSLPPKELLEKVGLDITKPEYYQKGLKVVSDMVDEFERLSK